MTRKINVIFESGDEALARELWERGRAVPTHTARRRLVGERNGRQALPRV